MSNLNPLVSFLYYVLQDQLLLCNPEDLKEITEEAVNDGANGMLPYDSEDDFDVECMKAAEEVAAFLKEE